MANQDFVTSLIEEIVRPGVQQLMETPYFSELREGKLSVRRLQGWALQHVCVSSNKCGYQCSADGNRPIQALGLSYFRSDSRIRRHTTVSAFATSTTSTLVGTTFIASNREVGGCWARSTHFSNFGLSAVMGAIFQVPKRDLGVVRIAGGLGVWVRLDRAHEHCAGRYLLVVR